MRIDGRTLAWAWWDEERSIMTRVDGSIASVVMEPAPAREAVGAGYLSQHVAHNRPGGEPVFFHGVASKSRGARPWWKLAFVTPEKHASVVSRDYANRSEELARFGTCGIGLTELARPLRDHLTGCSEAKAAPPAEILPLGSAVDGDVRNVLQSVWSISSVPLIFTGHLGFGDGHHSNVWRTVIRAAEGAGGGERSGSITLGLASWNMGSDLKYAIAALCSESVCETFVRSCAKSGLMFSCEPKMAGFVLGCVLPLGLTFEMGEACIARTLTWRGESEVWGVAA